MKTQVAIIGAGPAGMLLCELLDRQSVASVVLERQSRSYVLSRIRAGVLEPTTVQVLREAGLAERMDREGHVHDGMKIVWAGRESYFIDIRKHIGRRFVAYGQTTTSIIHSAPVGPRPLPVEEGAILRSARG